MSHKLDLEIGLSCNCSFGSGIAVIELAGRPTRHGMSSVELLVGCFAVFIGIAIGCLLMRPAALQPAEKDTPKTAFDADTPGLPDSGSTDGATNVDIVLQEVRRLKQEVTRLRESQDSQATFPVNTARANTARVNTAHVNTARVNTPSTVGRRAPHNTPTNRQPPAARVASQDDVGRRTLQYWKQLNEIMATEEQQRKPPSTGITVANAADFLSRRGQAGQFAAKAIRQLNPENVDAEVVSQAMDIASWYEAGNRLNDTAQSLFHHAGSDERRGQPGQQWGDGEKAHGQSVNELNRRGDALRRRMIQKYGLPFPDLR